MYEPMATQHSGSTEISEQQRQRLVAWEMEYGRPIEFDAGLREAYETLRESGGAARDGSGSR